MKLGFLRTGLAITMTTFVSLTSLASVAFAQTGVSDDTYSLASGSELEWAAPWEIDERTSGFSQDAAGDVVTLGNGDARAVLTTYPGIISPVAARDALLAQYEQTRENVVFVNSSDNDSDAVSSLISTDAQSDTWGSYSEWSLSDDGQTIIGIEMVAPVDGIGTAIKDAQASITLDGAAVLPDADATAIEESMSAAANDVPSTGKKDTGKSTTKTKTGKTSNLDPGFVDAGLTSETGYTSPQFGYNVTWNTPWTVNPGDDTAVVSDPDGVSDELYLATDDPSNALVSISGIEANGTTPADATETWASQDYLDNYTGVGTEVLLQDSNRSGGAVVTLGPLQSNADVTVVIVRKVLSYDGGDTLVLMTLIVPVDQFAAVYASAQVTVLLEGEPALAYFTSGQIDSVLP
ncbi:MAG: hypothetical protein ACR2OU_19540 [Thermomicrobiales bacterium]